MGSVWLAQDKLLGRSVALKELLRNSGASDWNERRTRAMHEAKAMALVKHPAIVRIHDVFFDEDDPWIVMEHIKGQSLAHIIGHRGRLGEQEIARIGLPVLRGLDAAHQANVLHRDVKPANILVSYDGSIFLVDFGIAKIAGDMTLTTADTVVGTTEFLAPERISGDPVGPAADLWALGITFFCALEGYSPFLRGGEERREMTTSAILHDPTPALRSQGRLADVVPKLLNKDPAKRVQAEDLTEILQSIIHRQAAVPSPGPYSPPRPRATPDGQGPHDIRGRAEAVSTPAEVAMLLAMPDDRAARTLAGFRSQVAGELIQAMAATRPASAAAILQTMSATGAGRAMDYLTPQTAASLLSMMSSGEAARILGRTSDRTAAAVIAALPAMTSAKLIKAMQTKRAGAILEYVRPAIVAGLLRTAPDHLAAMLLGGFSDSFRTQVVRYL
jgi:flagellar motility protein MotE (MotC chaperone)